MQRKIKGFSLAAALNVTLLMANVIAPQAMAAESVISPTPTGGTDFNQALLPPTGLYGGLALIPGPETPYSTDANSHRVQGGGAKAKAVIGAAGLLYVYPTELFGGSIASSIQASAWDICLTPFSSTGSTLSSIGECKGGIGDIYADVFYWSKNVGLFGAIPGPSKYIPYGLTIAGGLAMKAPTGASYVPSNLLNFASNLWIFTPNLAITYNTGPNLSLGDSTQFSARLFLPFAARNPTTGYQSGNSFDLDFAVSEIFGNWQVGAAGYYTLQYEDDDGFNVATGLRCPGAACIDGNRNGQLAIGPAIQYTFPDSGVFVKAKYSADVWSKNNLSEQTLTLQIGMKIF
jgi:hypothetical protein